MEIPRWLAALAALVGTLIVVAPAAAATTIGSLPSGSPTITTCGGSGAETEWLNQSPGSAVTAPSAGVVTSIRTQQVAARAGHHFKVKVITLNDRSFSPSANATVTASSDALTIAGTGSPESFPTRLPIAAGQGVALFSAEAIDCAYSTSDTGDQVLFNGNPEPGPGTTFFAQNGATSARVILQATIEPDADGDGFGDETQDSCPSDPATSSGPCVADLAVTATTTPATIGVGDVAVMTGSVTNAGNATGKSPVLHLAPGSGLQIVASLPSSGCSFTTDLACPLADLVKGATVPFVVVVKGVSTGSQTLTASIASATSDPNAANNSASGTVTVEKRVAVRCNVPNLKGLTKSFAKKLLAAVNCKLGKVTRKTSKTGKKGTVIKQSKKPKSVLAAGSKVAVTLKK